MSFPAYPEYKDSGVEWLGEVPGHWSVKALKRGADVMPSNVDKHSVAGEPEVFLCNYTDVYYNECITSELEFMRATATARQIEKFTLQTDDVLVTKDSEDLNDIGVPAHVPNRLEGVICGYHLAIVRPTKGAHGRFLKYFFESDPASAYFAVTARGLTRVGLSQDALNKQPVAWPRGKEQVAIARFLDHETARIDALIEEQKRLIELLKEKRQAVISHAVTKGLDPNVRMKDSGVEWLGEVPAHWVVGPLRWYATVQGGIAKGKSYESGMATVERPYLRVANVQDGYVDLSEIHHIEVAASEADRYALRSGDVLMNEGGDNDKLGRGTVWRGEIEGCLHQNHVFSIRPNEHLSPEWLSTFTRSDAARSYFYLYSKQSTNLASVSSSNVMSCPLPIPPRQEQEQILKQIDTKVRGINSLMEAAESMMNFLGERRSALISAAVTGKIDVRDWQPPEGYAHTEAKASEGASV